MKIAGMEIIDFIFTVIAVAAASLLIFACHGVRAEEKATPQQLVMGFIPAENNDTLIKDFDPLRRLLEKRTGCRIKLITVTDYTAVIEAMKKKRVDIAWFGPLSYVLAEQEAGAEAFAAGISPKTGKSSYRSIITVPGNSPARKLEDLKGKTFAFVDPASTSGGLIPRYMIKKATGLAPSEFFGKFIYAGSHDAAELAVKNKTVDGGVSDDVMYDRMIEKGLITKESNRIIAISDEIPGAPLAYRADLPENLKKIIKETVLNAHKEIKVLGYGAPVRYEEKTPKDYEMIKNLVKGLGLQREQILKK
jgi:phosphonate transport system substrate-binding protein